MSAAPLQPAPPTTVVWAVRLYLIGAALGLVGALVLGVLIPANMAAARANAASALAKQTGSVLTADDLVAIQIGVSVLSILMSIGFAIAMTLLALRMREGGNRARVALIVLAALQIVGAFGSYGVGFVHFLVVAAALVLSVLPASNAWFRAVRADRARP